MPSPAGLRVWLIFLAGLLLSPLLRAADPPVPSKPAIELHTVPADQLTPGKPAPLKEADLLKTIDPDDAQQLYIHGLYEKALARATALAAEDPRNEAWPLLRCQAELQLGKYDEARADLDKALVASPNSLRLRVLGYDLMRRTGDPLRAKALVEEMDRLGARSWAYTAPEDQIALGRAALLVNADPKKVLDRFFTPVKKLHPELREVWLASGELALQKSEFSLAAKTFSEAAKRFPNDPDVQFGLARAFAPSDSEAEMEALESALHGNPRHLGALLLLAEHHIDAEHPEEAAAALAEVLKIDPKRAEAHALRAVQAELAGDAAGFKEEREAALKPWPKNPEAEHLIGRKLSQKYRFTEGAEHQRRALEWEPENLQAKLQLAQDLLRLGHEEEGWKLAQEVRDADPYDVFAYNLTTLEETLSKFAQLPSEHFLVKMEAQEAQIYGPRVVALLERAHAQVGPKYGFTGKQKITVEIFPDQKDFAIRTFGLPGGAGYLGVCFGNVITANSPAANPNLQHNWESVLWHEFTHVVTLGLTKNKMPRWLSEGISVYEERQARGNWGEQMKPRYRAMILGNDLVPLSQLSGSFLRPKTPMHLQFAYYESSLAVEYLIERFGLPAMKAIFADLAQGVGINAALAKRAAPLADLDREFGERIRRLAQSVGPQLDWANPKPADVATEQKFTEWVEANPTNYAALMEKAKRLLEKREWAAAKAPLEKLLELYPDQHDAEGAYAMLARVQRELGEADAELATLTKLATLSSGATDAFLRLMEIHTARQEWKAVAGYAEQFTAVNPLVPAPHREAARAWEKLGDAPHAIAEYETLLKLGGSPEPEAHYALAGLLKTAGKKPEAKRHVLQALEDAPRYREALRLLKELQ
ncbi:MAG TPA: tetratricopeptide repeat protein [Chthoniobacteraceae bacterium]|nr:tetratricopeptide repeat protein [Chthoniobacteraceae bacterium]